MSAKHRRSRPRNPHPRPYQAIAPGRQTRGRTKLFLWLTIAAFAGVIVYAATGPLRTRKAAAALTAPRAATASPAARVAGPRIQFANRVYDFGKATGDDQVDCLFVFTNTGTALLEVSEVSPGCGCMKAGEWSRKVEPGRTGTIPVRYDSRHYTGPFAKSVFVTCNDTSQPNSMLEIKGNVWRPLEITPPSAVLNLSAETPSNATSVRLISHLEEPLTLSELATVNSTLVVELQTNQPGKDYQLNVRTAPPWPTNSHQGQITFKTSATNAPTVNIPLYVNVQAVLVAIPYLVRLPAPPLTNTVSTIVRVRNNGTNAVILSEPVVSAAGVEAQIKADELGRMMLVELNFPAGFEIAPGSNAELRVKTDHPLFPVLKVPVLQSPRQASAAAAGRGPLPLK